MTYANDDYQSTRDNGSGFLLGLLSGAALGVGIGMLFAPRSGAQLRETLARSAGDIQRSASETLNQVSDKVRETTDRGRSVARKAAEAWSDARETAATGVGSGSSTNRSDVSYTG